jgi:hypothetical protein
MPALNYAALRGLADRSEAAPHGRHYTSEMSYQDRYYDQAVHYPEEYGGDPYHDLTADYGTAQNHTGTDPSSPYGERKSSLQVRVGTPLISTFSLYKEEFRPQYSMSSTGTCKANVDGHRRIRQWQ